MSELLSNRGPAPREYTPLNDDTINQLRSILGAENVLTDPADLYTRSIDASFVAKRKNMMPEAVIYPSSTEALAEVVKLANERRFPVTPRGGASGAVGGALAAFGGVVVDMTPKHAILKKRIEDLQVEVQAGIVHAELNKSLAEDGCFFPAEPASTRICTLGGMVANNSSGMRAFKYGTTRNWVLGMEVVLPTGEVIRTGGLTSRVLKTVSGLELTHLFIGSEGTLGIITELRLRVAHLPEARGVVLAGFEELEAAGLGVLEVLKSGAQPSAMEIIDRSALAAARNYMPDADLPDHEAVLLIECDGGPATVQEGTARVAGALADLAVSVRQSTDPVESEELWRARRVLGAASIRMKPNVSRVFDGEDIAVPMRRVPEALRRAREITGRHGLAAAIYGHIGDGNLHVAMVADLTKAEEMEAAARAADELQRMAIELEGTSTAEHGVGFARAQYMPREHGPALGVMRAIKQALDPNNIMNPGKIAL